MTFTKRQPHRSLVAIVFATIAFLNLQSARAADPPFQRDIAVYDRLLAKVKAGQKMIRFGDVGITPEQARIFRDRLVAARKGAIEPNMITPAGTTFKWPGGNVYYRFDAGQVGSGTITALKMQQFRDGVAEWAAFANLHFIEFTGTPPANFITVQQNTTGSEGGFSSAVGMAGGEQFLQFGNGSWNRGTICHEVGHAIGLWHEQQRPDRDTYVVLHPENFLPGTAANWTIVPDGQLFGTAYDFYSVMHYSRNALSSNGQDTMTMQPGSAQYLNVIGQIYDRTLSKIERAGMASVYGNPSPLPSAVVTNTNDSGPGSLRAAIYYAFDRSTDAVPTPTTITFHIPTSDPNYSGGVFTIRPTYLLDALGNGTTVDGTSQTAFTGNTNPNGPEIVLDGSNFTALGGDPFYLFSPGLILRAANCTIKGLTITNFNQWGIHIFQGSDPNGSAATGNVIGGTTAGSGNVMSGNAFYGIAIHDPTTTGNLVQGNYIGTDQTGTAAQPNLIAGVVIYLGAHGNVIGGGTASARNVISGNTYQGVFIGDSGSTNNAVQGNYLGLNATGTAALPNAEGVEITNGAQANTIGPGNVISGNQYDGVDIDGAGTNGNAVAGNVIGLNPAGSAKIQNGGSGVSIFNGAQSTAVGGTSAGARNVISGNQYSGVAIGTNGTNNNLVQGNYIGLDPGGTIARGNSGDGVAIYGDGPAPSPSPAPPPNTGAQSNIIGGTVAGARNVISGNGGSGVSIGNPGSSGTNNNLVQGNYIGVDAGGANAQANGGAGVALYGGAQSNTIGGTVIAARNVIAGNAYQGVTIGGIGSAGQTVGPRQNLVAGNYIGVDANGAARGNGSTGVDIYGAAQMNTLGGAAPGARNIISGNTYQDIAIRDANTTGNTVLGNLIGLDPVGLSAIVGANTSGIGIYGGAQNNTIGGTSGGARNFICGHQNYGLFLADAGTMGNLVQGNTIGLNVNGVSVPNSYPGIAFFNNAQSNAVGGSAAGASNIISGNANEGIAVYSFGSTTIRETLSRNSIFANGGVGIALYDGGNNSQPSPALTSAAQSTATNPGGTDVSGTYSGTAGTIEFFASSTADPSGFGEGQFFIGSIASAASFTAHLAPVVPAGYVISATATDADGNTSQFSQNVTVPAPSDNGNDGLPDQWMLFYFGHTDPRAIDLSRATDDADGDGLTNLQEFLAGTDPRSATNAFRITAFSSSVGNRVITFASVAGKTYRVEYKDDARSANWTLLQDQVAATGSSTQVTDASANATSQRFYRVSIEP